jgi:hypothetical protein
VVEVGDARGDQEPAGNAGGLTLRPKLAALAAACLVFAAGCGSSTQGTAPPATPKLPQALAQRLASESDVVASALASGNACAAREAGSRLRADATASIGHVPVRLQEPLSSGVNALVAALPACVSQPQESAAKEPAAKEHPSHGPKPKKKPKPKDKPKSPKPHEKKGA